MNQITDHILIGTVYDARNVELVRTWGVRSILGLINSLASVDPKELGVETMRIVPLLDGEGNEMAQFRRAVGTLTELVETASPVLVHCQAGWSRSPAVVAAYLVAGEGMSAEAALAAVAEKRSCSMSTEMREMVVRFARELRG